jgi:Fe-Mn family superoxide dismutase
MITRREAIKTTALIAAAAAVLPETLAQTATSPAQTAGPFNLPPLPYAYDALEPHIDARTMEIHHDRHHAGYVANLNKAVAELPSGDRQSLEGLLKNLESAPEKVRTAIRNNGGGHLNHSWFWQMMSKSGGGEPKAELAKAIEGAFGNVAAFKEAFGKAASTRFGSGWAWLVWNAGKLEVVSTANQDTPVMGKLVAGCEGTPLLGLDVWEHAYYLKYQNKRADYIAAWWNVVNWDVVTERYLKARG